MSYIYLLLAILLETAGSVCLKLSEGFTRPWPVAGVCVAYIACFYFLSLSIRTIPLGVAYALWAALGIVLSNLVGVLLFRQSFDLASALGIALIVGGVVVLQLFSESAH